MSSLLGAGFGALLTSTLSDAELQSWGWRIPFLFGALIGPIGLYIRISATASTMRRRRLPPGTIRRSATF
jgi:MFS family permease